MPSSLHEVLVDLFRERPQLALELIDDDALPAYDELLFDDPTFNQIAPAEFRADAVIALRRAGRPVLALIVEVQLRAVDNKRYAWPVYLTNVPKVTNRAEASATPQLAVLSALTHARDADASTVAAAALAGVETRLRDGTLDDAGARLYCDLILHAVGPRTAAEVETMIRDTDDYKSEFAQRYFGRGVTWGVQQGIEQGIEQGAAAAKAAMLLRAMAKRGLHTSAQQIARVDACRDAAQLERWFDRAVVASSADEVFADDA